MMTATVPDSARYADVCRDGFRSSACLNSDWQTLRVSLGDKSSMQVTSTPATAGHLEGVDDQFGAQAVDDRPADHASTMDHPISPVGRRHPNACSSIGSA